MNSLPKNLETLAALYDANREEILKELFSFLSFPSISTEAHSKKDIVACARWLHDLLEQGGFETELIETSVHPVVFATWLNAGKDKPTVLFYGHYDVQPVDPLSEWLSPPFTPTVRNGELYARGAADNKGQCFYTICALRALLKRDGRLPINVKICIEGEEEAGSRGLEELLLKQPEMFQADHVIVVDLALRKPDVPSVVVGLRGIVAIEIEITESKVDLHSGGHGGMAYNPNRALVELLSSLVDSDGRIQVPGFYDDVVELSAAEREQLNFEFSEPWYEKEFGMKPLGGEVNEFTPLERAQLRPTLEINGIGGGYVGDGFKTVIPARATAKLSCRLVPNQNPEKIGALVTEFLKSNCPKGVKLSATFHHCGAFVRTPLDTPVVKACANAFSEVFGMPCQYILEGGSVPIVPALAKAAKGEVALIGYGLPTDAWHSPNEHFGLDRFRHGFVTIARIVELLAQS